MMRVGHSSDDASVKKGTRTRSSAPSTSIFSASTYVTPSCVKTSNNGRHSQDVPCPLWVKAEIQDLGLQHSLLPLTANLWSAKTCHYDSFYSTKKQAHRRAWLRENS